MLESTSTFICGSLFNLGGRTMSPGAGFSALRVRSLTETGFIGRSRYCVHTAVHRGGGEVFISCTTWCSRCDTFREGLPFVSANNVFGLIYCFNNTLLSAHKTEPARPRKVQQSIPFSDNTGPPPSWCCFGMLPAVGEIQGDTYL